MTVFQPQSKKVYWFLTLVFFIFSVAIGIAGYFFHDHQKKILRQEKWDQLNAIADLKVRQIVNWRKERMEDAAIIQESPFIADHLKQFMENPKAAKVKQGFLDWMASFQRRYHYQSVFLLDARGAPTLSVAEGKEVLGVYTKTIALEAMRKKEVIFSDIHRGEAVGEIHIDLLVPLFDSKNKETLSVGAVLLRIHPNRFLYPLIQLWPTPSRTSESLLVRREGEEVLFLNELRHQKGTALKLRFPTGKMKFPAVVAVEGKEGIVEGPDYRGVSVLAAIRPIPDSPWFLVAKVDQEEIYAPIHMRMRLIAFIIGLLIVGAGLIVVLLWRHQRAEHYKRQFQAEHEYRKLMERYEYLTRHANDIILLMDQDLKIVEANERAVEQYGYSREELLQKKLTDLRSPETLPLLGAQFEQVKKQNGAKIETYHLRKDGTRFPVENSARVIQIEGETFLQSIIRDLTERKRAEEVLRESEEKYRLVVENAGEAILIAQDAMIQFVNPKATEIMGYSYDEFIFQPFMKFIHPEDKEKVLEYHLKRTQGKVLPEIYSFRLIDKKGNINWTEINVVLITWKGKPATLNYLRDITERKRSEEEKAFLQEQLRQSQKIEAIGQLAGGIAHDFNNLLTIISGNSQLSLLDLKQGDPLRVNIEEIKRASELAADLIRQLLAFSRKQVMEMRVLDLNLIIQGLDKMLNRLLGEDIDLMTVLPEGIGKIKADSGQIEQIIVNLAVNARDAMPDGGKLTIETTNVELDEEYARKHIGDKPGRYVMLSVSDTGVGMTSEVKDRVFDPFFTTKEMGKGTGLGLSTVYGIVKQSGGNIWVYSEPGQGTTFKIYLLQVDEPLTEEKQEVVKEIPRGDETILLVEDEEAVRKLAIRLLKGQGYRVLEASDGGKALLLCEGFKETIHLILTDVVMPGMSGRKLAERLKQIHPEMKVLYMSGYSDNAIVHHGVLEEGINFIQKPFTRENLARKVREALDK